MSSISQRQQQGSGTGTNSLSMLAQHAKSGSPRGIGGVGSTAHTGALGQGQGAMSDPLLQLRVGGRSLTLRPGLTYTLGCGPAAHVQLMGGGVENRHAQIHNNKLRVLYVNAPITQQQTDSGRMLGPSTRLNGREVEVGQAAPLRHGDQIVIGSHIIRVEDMSGADSTQTQMQQHERDTGIGGTGLQQQQQHTIPDKERDSATYGEKGLGLAPTGTGRNLNDQQYGKGGGIIEQQHTNAAGQQLSQTGAGLGGASTAYTYHDSNRPSSDQYQVRGTGEQAQQPLAIVDRPSAHTTSDGIHQRGVDQQQSSMGMTPLADYTQQQNTLPMQQVTLPMQSSHQIGQQGIDQQYGERRDLDRNHPLGQTAGGAGLVGTGAGTQQQHLSQQSGNVNTGQSLAQTGAGLAGIGAAYHDGNIPPSERSMLPGADNHHTAREHDRDADRQLHQGTGVGGQHQQYDQTRTADHTNKPGLMDRIGLGHHGTTHTGTGAGQHTLGQGDIGQQHLDPRGTDQQYDQSGNVVHSKPDLMERLGIGHGSGQPAVHDQSQLGRDGTIQHQSGVGDQSRFQPLEPTTAAPRSGSGSGSYMLAPSYSTTQLASIFGDMVELSGSRLSDGASRNLPHWFNLFPAATRQELNSSHLKKWLQSAKDERQMRLAGDGVDTGATGVDSQQGSINSNSQQLPSAAQAARALCATPSTDRNELTESDFVLGLLAMQAAGDIGSGGSGVDSATRGVNSLGLQSSSGWTDSARQSGNSVGGLGQGSHAQSDYALLTLLSDLCEVGGWRLGGGWETAVRFMLGPKHCAPQRRQGISSHLKQWIRAAIADHQRMQQQPLQQGQGSVASAHGNNVSGMIGGGQILSPLNLAHGLITTHGL